MEQDATRIYDVAVIGGGASGMMAAGVAAERGARVVLVEKNPTLGKKLLITGGGRCNVTNAEFDTRAFLSKFRGRTRKDDNFLFSAFAQFGVKDSIEYFNARGMDTKVEANNRVFPLSNSAQSVWDVFMKILEEKEVRIITGQTAKEVLHESAGDENSLGDVTGIRLGNDQVIRARSYILATGGVSHPETGSTGDGFAWLSKLGHTVSGTDAALVPIALKEAWVKKLAGVTLQNIGLTLMQSDERQLRVRGRILFTHKGATGPTILNMSRDIGQLLKYGPLTLQLDLVPDTSIDGLDTLMQRVLAEHSNKKVRNALGEIIPPSIVSPLLELASVDQETPAHSLTREARLALGALIKCVPVTVTGLLGLDKAVVTSGGVALTEVDFKTMRSRKYSNLYILGDLLDLDRPSGGYSLQLCWTTGFVAGAAAAR